MRCISATSFCMSSRLGLVAHQGQRKLEPRQDRPQIMADPVEHGGALLDRALDAPLHLDEGIAGLAHFARAARPKLGVAPLAESFRRRREPQDRLDLIAQEADGDDDQHEGSAEHPENEDIGIRGIGGAAIGDHAQDRMIEQNPDLDEIRAAHRIEPERPADLPP